MNKCHRLIWIERTRTWVAVAETARARGKRASGALLLAAAGLLLAAPPAPSIAAPPNPPAANQLPTGGTVAAGQAGIAQSGAVMNINQSSQRAVIDWQTFNVGSAAQVNFRQPGASSVTLNRVLDSNPSQIFGKITAPGQVFLTNPNGMYFAAGASVDVGGLTATTHSIDNADFMAGNYRFTRNGATGSVVNEGSLTASLGGYIALLAPEVRNNGVIVAQLGTVALAAGEAYDLQFDSNNTLANIRVTPASIKVLVDNGNAVHAPGGLIILSAQAANSVQGGVVRNSGKLEANSLTAKGGRIVLEGDDITLAGTSRIEATGAVGGGTILVGGDWQGSGSMVQATRVTMKDGAVIDASALQSGDGGKVVLWSDVHDASSVTEAHGEILAKGGAQAGNGGEVETSGHHVDISGVRVTAAAPSGTGGQWLIDPYNYTIDATAASAIVGNSGSGLNSGTSVTVDTSTSVTGYGGSTNSADTGDIALTSAIAKTLGGDATLTLKAARHVVLQGGASISSTNGKLNLLFWADSDNSGDGIIQNASTSIGTNGGWIKFGNNQTATINGSSVLVGGDVFFNGASAQTITTGGGAVDVYGETIIANTSGVTLNTGGGNVKFWGLLNSGDQYTFVPVASGGSWDSARTAAIGLTGGGSSVNDTYLVTITSRLENAMAGIAAGYQGAWIGAYRPTYTSGTWVWADGPEAGKQFFAQTTNGSGGTTSSGYFSNFGSGEPNGCMTASTCERVGQFFGSAGQWNDLSASTAFGGAPPYGVIGYVRETNLAPSPLTISAGSGTVTFTGAVGSLKPLGALGVTAGTIAINGGGVTTGMTGYGATQTYNGDVTLGSASTTLTSVDTPNDFVVASGNSITNASGGDATLTIKTTADIVLGANSYIGSSSPNGKLNTVLWADTDANGGAISLGNGSISTNGGNLWLGGGSGTATWNALTVGNDAAQGISSSTLGAGIWISGTTIATAGGDISMYGKGVAAGSGSTPNTPDSAANVGGIVTDSHAAYSINSGTGRISLTGKSYATYSSDNPGAVYLNGGTLTSAATSGTAITINGDASAVSGANTAFGTDIVGWGYGAGGNIISATGGGAISITGTGGGGAFGNGIRIINASTANSITANGGAIDVNGTATSTTLASAGNAYYRAGVHVNGANTFNSGNGNITITGHASTTSMGVGFDGSGTVGLNAGSGALNVIGYGSGTGTDQLGIEVTGVTLAASNTSSSIFSGDTQSFASTVSGSGALTIQPITANTTIGIAGGTGTLQLTAANFSTNFANGFSGITVGRSDGTGSITANAFTFYDPVTLLSGGTAANASLSGAISDGGTSTSSGSLTVKVGGNIVMNAGATVTTHSQPVILWSDFDGNGDGSIWLHGSTAITTNGGHLWMGGGTTSGTAWNGLTVGGGFAIGNATNSNGIEIDGTSIATNGGNIAIYGQSRAGLPSGSLGGANADGVWITNAGITTINSGVGTILIHGVSQGTGAGGAEGIGVEIYGDSQSVTSAATTGNAVSIIGIGSSGGNPSYSDGIYLHANESISATGGGNISLNGTGGTHGEIYGVNFSASTSTANAGTGNLSLTSGGSMNLDGPLTGSTVTLTGGSSATVSGSGNISATSLLLNGNGATYTLNTATGNSVGTLAASTGSGSVSFYNNAALGIGTVGGINGITTTGTVDVETLTGDLTVSQSIATTSTSLSAVILNAGRSTAALTTIGGNILISGSPTISVGSGGIAKLYSGSVLGSTGLSNFIGSGSGRFRYASDETTTNYATALSSGNSAIYRERPTVTTTAAADSKTYSGTAYSGGNGVTYGGFANGDTSAVLGGTLAYGGISQGAVNTGTYAITPGGYTNGLGYALAYTDGTLTINKAHLTVTADNQSRLYGQANPTLTETVTGFVNGEGTGTAAGYGGAATGSTTAIATTSVGPATISASAGTLVATNYDFTNLVDGTLTINKAHLTVTADNQSRLYGQANPTLTETVTGFVNGEGTGTAAGYGGAATGSTTAIATTSVGPATISASAGTLVATNYDFTNLVDGTLTINKAHLTVTADNQSRLYGQANPTLTETVTGFVNGEGTGTAAGYGGAATGSTTAIATTSVGPATISASAGTLVATNYDFTNLVDGTLTINKAHLTVTADNQSRLYGQANPTLTETVTGFVNGEGTGTAAGYGGAATGSTTAIATTSVGPATISASAGTLVATNYDFTNLVDGTLTINKAHLTVTADNQSRLYGQANPTLTETVTGFVNGEGTGTAAGYGGAATGSTTAIATTSVGPATISASAGTLVATNYDFTNLVDGTLTINKAHLTVTADNQSRLYGQANPTLTETVTGFVNGEGTGTAAGYGGAATGSTTAIATTSVGPATISASAGTLVATNYDFTNLVDGTLTINKAHLTVTADNQSRLYGQANPTLTETVTGFVNGEGTGTAAGYGGAATGSTTAIATTSVGPATISASAGTLVATNYDFTNLVDGTLTINKAHLTVTADNQSRLYGQANPTLTETVTGFVNGEGTGTAAGYGGAATGSTTAIATTSVGPATISASAGTLVATNYDFTNLVDGTLTINKAHLTVTADNQSRLYGQANPTLTETVTGFVNGEGTGTAAGYGGAATGSTTAIATTSVGPATISASAGTLVATNYDFTNLVDGTLTINPAPPLLPVIQPPALPSPISDPPPISGTPLATGTTVASGTPGAQGTGAGTSASGTATSGAGAVATSSGVIVSLLKHPSVQDTGVVSVSVPKGMAMAVSGFSFTLPAQVAQTDAGDALVRVTTITGGPLPGWLRYVPESKTFVVSAAPDGAFPMLVIVTVGSMRTTISISERVDK